MLAPKKAPIVKYVDSTLNANEICNENRGVGGGIKHEHERVNKKQQCFKIHRINSET